MKIGILSREYPPLTHVGGIATYSAAAAELLARSGHEVHVVCNGPEPGIAMQRGVTVHRVAMLNHHFPAGRLVYPYRAWYRKTLPHYLDALTWARTAADYLGRGLDAGGFDAWEFPETSGEGAFFPTRYRKAQTQAGLPGAHRLDGRVRGQFPGTAPVAGLAAQGMPPGRRGGLPQRVHGR